MPTITVLNQKGGSAKTSTCFHLSGTLAAMGKRVLLVDNDPQSSLTQGFFGATEVRQVDPSRSIMSIYRGDLPFPEDVIRETGIPEISIIPGSKTAMDFNLPKPWESDPVVQNCLKDFLAEVDYDFVLIDCPPNLHLCSWAAMISSNYLIVPAQPEDFGAMGIVDVEESWEMVKAGPNPTLMPLGILLTRVGLRKSIHIAFEQMIRKQFDSLVFNTKVADSVEYLEAIAQQKPVAQAKPKGPASKVMKSVANEIFERIVVLEAKGVAA